MSDPFVLGWEEWASLPDLGLPAIKVKVDTGARTSALHATGMRVEGPADARTLSFLVHPVRRRAEPAIACRAPLVGERVVTSSNGESERRYVIATRIRFGERSWPIEITLTNRESMSYRMLLGRNALAAGMLVDPLRGLLQPRLSYR
ncbi:MAG TPA: RimK/LysX family protein, partial [Hyphomicrobiaceae bacterium]|nr:RimK/LysX family protein [Hyphomicrobiaceae bacterium]